MGKKRKRSRSRDYDSLLKKIKSMEKELKKKQRRLSSTSSSDNDSDRTQPRDNNATQRTEEQNVLVTPSPTHPEEMIQNQFENNEIPETNDEIREPEPEIDPEILEILGQNPSSTNSYGANLHKEIIPRWKHILTNGLEKDIKSELLKQYLPPENCQNLKAPKLNLEIKAAINDINLKKETFSENKQNQLSSCLAAIGKALNMALSPSDVVIPQEITKYISDAGRLLCDLHYRESQSRRYAIINVLNKEVRDTVKNTKIDEYLFGSDLSEQLKSAKAITKSGSELKIPRPMYTKPPAPTPVNRGALNSRGARGATSVASTRQAPQRRPPASTVTPVAPRGRDHHRNDSSSSRRTNNRGRTVRR